MRATCEFAESKGKLDLPPIKVKIFKTRNDITIKISDQGGGIPRASSGKVFNYMYSTAPSVNISESGGSFGGGISSDTLPMHGLGYGLPLSRLYARYLHIIQSSDALAFLSFTKSSLNCNYGPLALFVAFTNT